MKALLANESTPVAVGQSREFDGPLPLEQLLWIGAGLLLIFALLAIRDAWLARRRWMVPLLLIMRTAACTGVFLVIAGPSEVTTKTYESKRGVGLYLDSSASMSLIDQDLGEGHLARWRLATDRAGEASPLSRLDRATTRVDVGLAMTRAAISDASDEAALARLKMLSEQIESTIETIDITASDLPFPSLVSSVRTALDDSLSGQIEDLLSDLSADSNGTVSSSRKFTEAFDDARFSIEESLQKLAAISRELARREPPADDDISRDQRARQLLQKAESEVLSKLGNNVEILRGSFSDKVSPADSNWNLTAPPLPEAEPPTGDTADHTDPVTDLTAQLEEIASQHREGRIEAAVLITDAVHNDENRPLQIPPGLKNFPLLILPVGGDAEQIDDITLWRASAPETLMRGDYLSVDCLIGSRGFFGETTQLRLLADGTELDSVDVSFKESGEDQTLRLTTPINDLGLRHLEVEIVALEGEKITANNRQSITVDVFSGDLQVLLIDGAPRWETRYLSNLLKRDRTAEHREILLTPANSNRTLSTTLVANDALDDFNVIIIGEVGPDFLDSTQLSALENFVDQGGSLIVIAGREHMPAAFVDTRLQELLPVRLDTRRSLDSVGCKLVPSSSGRRIAALSLEDDEDQNAAIWQLGSTRLKLSELSPYNVPKPGAQVILEAHPNDETSAGNVEPLPYIAWHRFGGGRVFYLPSPTTYFLRYRFGDRYHYRFWGQFLRWATMADDDGSSALVKVSSDARRYSEDSTPRIEIELIDAEGAPVENADLNLKLSRSGTDMAEVAVTEDAGSQGRYSAVLPELGHGEYQVRVTGEQAEALLAGIEEDQRKNKGDDEDIETPGITEFIVNAQPSSEAGAYACDWATARKLAESTGGTIIPPDGLQAALSILSHESGKRFRESITRTPLWDRWPLLIFILTFLCMEWVGRKYAGLI